MMDSKAQSCEENDVERGSEDLPLSSATYVRTDGVRVPFRYTGVCVTAMKKLCKKNCTCFGFNQCDQRHPK